MGKRKEVVLGSGKSAIIFKSQQEALAACKEMPGRYIDGETVNERDSELLGHLILPHPRSAEKIGAGISGSSEMSLPSRHLALAAFGLSAQTEARSTSPTNPV